MKRKTLLFTLIIVGVISIVGCNNADATKTNDTKKETVSTQATTITNSAIQNTISNSDEEIFVFVLSIANSARTIERYSTTEVGEIFTESYAFDNDCKFYTASNEKVSFDDFSKIIYDTNNNPNRVSDRVKCKIIKNKRLVSTIYIVD